MRQRALLDISETEQHVLEPRIGDDRKAGRRPEHHSPISEGRRYLGASVGLRVGAVRRRVFFPASREAAFAVASDAAGRFRFSFGLYWGRPQVMGVVRAEKGFTSFVVVGWAQRPPYPFALPPCRLRPSAPRSETAAPLPKRQLPFPSLFTRSPFFVQLLRVLFCATPTKLLRQAGGGPHHAHGTLKQPTFQILLLVAPSYGGFGVSVIAGLPGTSLLMERQASLVECSIRSYEQ
ncbi:hypothetical protein MTO96_025201 [Rhipicephalus appendiculatus]